MNIHNYTEVIKKDDTYEICKMYKDIKLIYSDSLLDENKLKFDEKKMMNINELYCSSGYIFLNEIINTDIILRHVDFTKYQFYKIPIAFYTNCIWSVNFYHFLFEEIPVMLKFNMIDPNMPIICNYNQSYCKELIELFKITNPIIPRTEKCIIKCDKLIHFNTFFRATPPSNYHIVRNYLIDNKIIEITKLDVPKKIGVLVKRNEWERQILNHDDFLNALNINFPDYSWIVFEGNIGLKKSIELFNSASTVISPQCSATVNMIFARPNTKFFKIIGHPYNLTGMYMLEKCGMDGYMISCDLSPEGNGRHFRLNLDKLIPVLKKYID